MGVIHHHGIAGRVHGNHLAVHRLGFIQLDDVSCCDFTGHDMVGEDRYKLGLIFRLQQIVDGAGRQLGKSRIGRREHGERTGTLQGFGRPAALIAAANVLNWPAATAVSMMFLPEVAAKPLPAANAPPTMAAAAI